MLSTYSVQLVQRCTEQLLAHALQVCLHIQKRDCQALLSCKGMQSLVLGFRQSRAIVAVCMLKSDIDGYLTSAL